MFKSSDLINCPDGHLHQEDNDYDEKQENPAHGNLDDKVHRIAANLRRRATCISCINDIEAEDEYTTLKSRWGQLQCFAQKPFVKEVAIITVILLLKSGLFLAYREASKANLEIGNL